MENGQYFRFSRKSIIWNDEIVSASLQNYSEEHLQIQREWWYGKPLSIPVPKLRFVIPDDGPKPDNFWNTTLFDLYSTRLVNIFETAGVAHELYPAEIVGKNSGKVLPVDYQIFRLLEIADVLDRAKSNFRYENHRGQSIEYLEKPVFKEEFLKLKKPFVRVNGFESIAIIHVDYKSLLEKVGISGCSFSQFD